MTLRTRIVLALTLAALVLLPGSALAAGWTAFSTVQTSGKPITGLKFAADASGNQVAIWVEQPSPFKVMAAVRPAGGTWATPQTLDSTATTLPTTDLAVDPNGNFIVLYSQIIGANKQFYSAYLPAGQTNFGNSQAFGNLLVGAVTPTGLAVAFAPDGTAWAYYGISGAAGNAGSRPAGAASAWTMRPTGLPIGSGNTLDLAVTSDGTPTLADYSGTGSLPRFTRFNGTQWV